MKNFQILIPGLKFRNTQAFLFPLLIWEKYLISKNIKFELIDNVNNIKNSDFLLLDSKYYKDQLKHNFNETLIKIKNLKKKTKRLIYVDTSDSTGWIIPEILTIVDCYWKSQTLKDKKIYKKPLYGHRIYTDYYNKKFNVNDETSIFSKEIKNDYDLKKIQNSWNFGLYDYSYSADLKFFFYKITKIKSLLNFDLNSFTEFNFTRPIDIFTRFGTNYSKNTIGHQRKKLFDIFLNKSKFNKVSKKKYFEEMRKSILTISPFGYGELCFRDFEAFMSGTILLKPDMSHLSTWPNFYLKNITYVPFSWDLADIEEIVKKILQDKEYYKFIAINGQKNYQKFTISSEAKYLFYQHFEKLIYKSC